MRNKFSFLKNQKFIFFLSLLFVVSGIAGLLLFPFSPFRLKTSQPDSISSPAPLRVKTIQGTVVGYKNNVLQVNSSEQILSLPVNQSQDVYQVTSGTVETGDAVTVKATISDLRTGQNVLIITSRNSQKVQSVYILK